MSYIGSNAINWEIIRTNFVRGDWDIDVDKGGLKTHKYPSLKTLSERYNIPLATLHTKSAQEKWSQLRIHYKAICTSDRAFFAEMTAKICENAVARANQLQELVERELQALEEGYDEMPPRERIQAYRTLTLTIQTLLSIGSTSVEFEKVAVKSLEEIQKDQSPENDYKRLKDLISKAMAAEKSAKKSRAKSEAKGVQVETVE